MERRLLSLWSFFIYLIAARCALTCDAPSVYRGQPVNVTCHADTDVSRMYENVVFYITNETGQHQVLHCVWLINQRYCNPSPGYSVVGNVTQKLVLGIPSATPEHVGTYVCQNPSQNYSSCNFTLKETAGPIHSQKEDTEGPGVGETTEDNSSRDTEGPGVGETTEDNSSRDILIVAGVVAAGVVISVTIVFCICKSRRRNRNGSGRQAPDTQEMKPLKRGAQDEEHDTEGPGVGETTEDNSSRDTEGPGVGETTEDNSSRGGSTTNIRILITGRTGSGKSTLGNSIVGAESFEPEPGFNSSTTESLMVSFKKRGCNYRVVDTPGLSCTRMEDDDVNNAFAEGLYQTKPGPHVILMVFRCDRRFSKEEWEVYKTLKKLLGEEMCKHMIVIFNAIDEFSKDDTSNLKKMRTSLDKHLENPSLENLNTILREVDNRYFGMCNNAPEEIIQMQADDLLCEIEKLVKKNNGEYCISPLSKVVEKNIKASVTDVMRQKTTEGLPSTMQVLDETNEVEMVREVETHDESCAEQNAG